MANAPKNIEERFWSKVDKTNGCWNWSAYVDVNGYGRFQLTDINRPISAHKMAWGLIHGNIPKKPSCVLHKCDNRKCVNPSHLFLGTQKENVLDMYKKNRQPRKDGEFNGRAKLDWKTARVIRYLFPNINDCLLGINFCVSRTIVRLIKKNEIWKENFI